jgi:hypothetical protein
LSDAAIFAKLEATAGRAGMDAAIVAVAVAKIDVLAL